MSYRNDENQDFQSIANIKIIGVGGGGNNSVESMIKSGIKGVDFIIANTDSQVLKKFSPDMTIHLGNINDSKGLGAGAKPEIGREAAIESESQIKEKLRGADMVIVAAGMGGGTGTGAAPVVAKVAKSLGALTIGIITTPFRFEGPKRMDNAVMGMEALRKEVDSLIIISNEKLRLQYGSIPIKDSFIYADTVLKQTVKTLTDIISVPALINLDFADVTTVMKDKGNAIIGIGRAHGKERARKAALNAISSPILEVSVKGAKDMIINITGGDDLSLDEANEIVDIIKEAVGENINIIFGVALDETLEKEISVSIIATGLSDLIAEPVEEVKTNNFSQNIPVKEVVEEKEEEIDHKHLFEIEETAEIEAEEEEDDDFPDEADFDPDEFNFEKNDDEEELTPWSNEFSNSHERIFANSEEINSKKIDDDIMDEDLDQELPAFLKR